jgi:hypothetical protein
MNYKEKYLKYKIKYLNLKNQIGNGTLMGCTTPISSSIPKGITEENDKYYHMTSYTSDYNLTKPDRLPEKDIIYDEFMETLDRINLTDNPNKILILKLGSSSIADAGSKHYFEPPFQILSNRIFRSEAEDIFIISMDPLYPDHGLLEKIITDKKIPEQNLCKFRGFFPLAPGSLKGNLILNKLININVKNLTIINEIGSGCYYSIRAILNNRPDTSYFVNVNNSIHALDCGINLYGKKGIYNRCKRENPDKFKNEWCNLKTLTDEGDDTEPETLDEKIEKMPEENKIQIKIKDYGKETVIDGYKDITVGELNELYFDKTHENIKEFVIFGKPKRSEDYMDSKLFELDTRLLTMPIINIIRRR